MSKTKVLLLRVTGRFCCVASVADFLFFGLMLGAGNKPDMQLVVSGLLLLCLGLMAEVFCDYIEYGI